MKKITGFLIDLDGVLYIEDRIIPGAPETVNWLRRKGFPFRFLTNTTMRSRDSLVAHLQGFGIQADPQEMVNTAVVAARWLAGRGISRVYLLLTEDAQKDFSGFEITPDQPAAVVVGDMGAGFTFEGLNRAFRAVKSGAELIALQKNRFWRRQDGLAMDAGAFVAALEYATETEAVLIGKPNRAYFEIALKDIGSPPSEVVMIGDDIHTDILGAQAVGAKTILVQTGKSPFETQTSTAVQPDWVIGSIADLPGLIDSLRR
jgi:HAD superfamily hydrolase (TIGR01458 family)